MRASKLFFPTLREVPSDAEMISHQLLLRGGFIRKVAAGIYDYLPLGYKVLKRIQEIVRQEMDAQGAQELLMPGLVPAELYQETGRWDLDVLFRVKDRGEHDYAIGFTHEEVVTDIVRRDVRSYRELPLNLYQIQTKGRDEPRPRGGIIRGREFIMLDAYSFDKDWEDLDRAYERMYVAFSRIFARCGLDPILVEAESGAIGGKENQEYMVLADSGEDSVLMCSSCGYAANAERCAIGERCTTQVSSSEMAELSLVNTPNARTIDEVTALLGKSPADLVKTLIYKTGDSVIAALIRGDRDLNEAKLARAFDVKTVTMADAETIQRVTGADVGFAGPIGLDGVTIIADREVAGMSNFVVGANKTDAHYVNANLDRDFKVASFADLRIAVDGDPCPHCEGTLSEKRGIEVGHIFKLGTLYSEEMNAKFLDDNGKRKPFVMGCYGMGVSRMLAAIPEVHNDAQGIIWPISVAPFEVTVILLNVDDEDQCNAAMRIYEELQQAGVDVLLDERDERPGVKFKDADLMGVPLQVVAGRLAAQGKVEIRQRSESMNQCLWPPKEDVDLDDATAKILAYRKCMYESLEEKAAAYDFKGKS